MKQRHLAHETFTLSAIEDIPARGRLPDWELLIAIIQADPYGEVAEKTRLLCDRPSFAVCLPPQDRPYI